MHKSRKWILPGALAGLLVIFLIFAFVPDPIPVDLHSVSEGDFSVFVEDDGEARVRDVYLVSSPLPGRVLRLDIEAGDEVVAGQTVLARILPTDPNFLDIRTRSELQSAVEAADAGQALAEAEVKRMEAEVAFARSEYERAKKLYEKGNIAQSAMDRSEMQFRTQEAALLTAQASLHIREHELETAKAALIDPSDQSSNPSETEGEGQCCFNVRSPISGRVLRVFQESEGIVSAGTPLIEIGNATDLEIVVDLLSTDAVKVGVGDPVEILRWGGEGVLNGVVDRVEPYGFSKISSLGIEEQRVNVIIRLTDPSDTWQRLGHGYRVEVRIFLWRGENVNQVPISALFRNGANKGEDWAVFLVKNNRAVLKEVKVGRFSDRMVEIKSGLSTGDVVILHPSDRINHNIRVEPRSL